MRDYLTAYNEFSVPTLAREILQGDLDAGLNAAIECCDRWANGDRVAINWIGKDFSEETVTFSQLREQSIRFATLLKSRGIGPGDTIGAMLPRIPELFVVVLGAWRIGAIYQPLFTAFGPAAVTSRVTSVGGSQAKLIVTDAANRPKLDEVENCPPVLIVDRGNPEPGAFAAELAAQPSTCEPVLLTGADPFIVLFTSGTTGNPKGVRWPLRCLLAIATYMRLGLDVRPEDRFWNVADPGWGYGMAYTVIGPLLLGHPSTLHEGGFTVDGMLRVLTGQQITNLAAAPTVYRLLMAAGENAMAPIAGKLRIASSAGEPLSPEVARWADRVLRTDLRNQYGQTETLITVINHHALAHEVKPGAPVCRCPATASPFWTTIWARYRRTRPASLPSTGKPRRCCASTAIGAPRRPRSAASGISPATRCSRTKMGITISSAVTTTSSHPPATALVPSTSKAASWNIRRWPRSL